MTTTNQNTKTHVASVALAALVPLVALAALVGGEQRGREESTTQPLD